MGVAFSSLWTSLFGSKELKICILGLDNAGKTTLMYKMTLGSVVNTAPTVGSNTETFEYKNLKFALWDVGGQTSLRTSWSSYLTATDAVIFVLDSNDKDRVLLAREELYRIASDEQVSKAPILIWANKQDIKGSLSPAEISEAMGLTTFRDRTWQIFGCSALTGKGFSYQSLVVNVIPKANQSQAADNPIPKAHERQAPDAEIENRINTLLATNRRTATDFTIQKSSREAAVNWDRFYKKHSDKFFKDRHWTEREFGAQISKEDGRDEEAGLVGEVLGSTVLLEVGCGVGNMLYPLLAGNSQLKVHCCDFSARAVEIVRSHPAYDEERVNAFVFDLTQFHPPISSFLNRDWPPIGTISIIFVLSAIPPHLHLPVLKSMAHLLPSGGHMVFRDYAYGDLSQVRYHTKKDAGWAQPSLLDQEKSWYKRGDGTFNYFFATEELDQMAKEVGLEGETEILYRVAVNRRSEDRMQRRFVQAKWTKL